ncbi:transketolase family protein [Picrophilus oshimae]|uniref:Transketolase subunit B n=1 Tax=Picrophilus torridus (strain ATCC 700027 / DSM 9790 / JCM 10055 / NBRC 100828 / KAW 2/3) TaxID=1122961 RepID=Q6L177_PICTO|nr:transketolase family protein [Picrophilus oshimae]AAT43275.1 transketolase subunit B [Picrophilus oshimae DSM 9789]SMD30418.1 transketolase subunit B [Picrophilus oshimae DSM 9789]
MQAEILESLREAYGDELARLGSKNRNIVVLDADLSSSTKTEIFWKSFPDRFFNMGISEQSMVTTAAGLALSGKKVFASTFAVFLSRTYEQLRQSICYNNAPVNFVVTHSGISVGEDGPTHQMLEDVGIMSGLPNMHVIVPADSVETRKVIDYLADYGDSPHYVRLTREKFPVIYSNDYEFIEGKASTLNDGNDITIIAYGIMVSFALRAADLLKENNISARVINMSSIKPIDRDVIIKAARETGRIITAEEHSIYNGLGSRVAEIIAENQYARLKRFGMNDTFGKSGKGMELFDYFHIGYKDLFNTAMNMVNGDKR